MVILLDTATPIAVLVFADNNTIERVEWKAERQLARGMLVWMKQQLDAKGKSWQDVDGIGVVKGPGSFTGLRIGIAIMNTLAENLKVPIVGVLGGEAWEDKAIERLRSGEDDKVLLPYYDRAATITTQRK